MNKIFANFELKAVQEDERIIEGVASTVRPDRMSDIVEPRGIVYALPVPFLLDHDHRSAVGEVEHVEVTDKEIRFRARIAKIAEDGPAKTLTDNAWSMIKAGLRKSVSIGFRSLAHERIDGGGVRYRSWELLELSAVAVPAQPDARILATRAAKPGKAGGHVVKLVKPKSGVVYLRRDDYEAHLLSIAKHNVAQPAHKKLIPPTYGAWLMVEDALDRRIPGRKAKREARKALRK